MLDVGGTVGGYASGDEDSASETCGKRTSTTEGAVAGEATMLTATHTAEGFTLPETGIAPKRAAAPESMTSLHATTSTIVTEKSGAGAGKDSASMRRFAIALRSSVLALKSNANSETLPLLLLARRMRRVSLMQVVRLR